MLIYIVEKNIFRAGHSISKVEIIILLMEYGVCDGFDLIIILGAGCNEAIEDIVGTFIVQLIIIVELLLGI